MISVGVDAGSRAIKVVLHDAGRGVVAAGVADQGIEQERLACDLLNRLRSDAGLNARMQDPSWPPAMDAT